MSAVVTLDLTELAPDARGRTRGSRLRRARGGRRAPVAARQLRADGRRAALPLAGVVRRSREEHQPRRRAAQGRRGTTAERAALAAMIARFAACARRPGRRRCSRGYAPYVKRARTSYRPQPGRRPRRVVAQGRLAAARRCVSVAAEPRASASCACSRTSIRPRTAYGASASRSRRWRRRCCRAITGPVPGAAVAARGAARHQGPAHATTTT